NKRDKLDFALFSGIARRVGLAHHSSTRGRAQERQEVAMEDEAQYQEDDEAADADVNAADLKSSTAFTPAIFNVVAASTQCPSHESISKERRLTHAMDTGWTQRRR